MPSEAETSAKRIDIATDPLPIAACSPLLTPATDAADAVVRMPLATLLAGNVVPQGEIVNLLIKPSRWFILLNSMRFAAIVIVVVAGLHALGVKPFIFKTLCVQLAVFFIAGRVMWSVVEWMGRYYILTDMRLMRVCGVFDVSIHSCVLRKVEMVKLYSPVAEKLLGRGSLDIFGCDQKPMIWQTIGRPEKVLQQVRAAVYRAKSNGGPP